MEELGIELVRRIIDPVLSLFCFNIYLCSHKNITFNPVASYLLTACTIKNSMNVDRDHDMGVKMTFAWYLLSHN